MNKIYKSIWSEQTGTFVAVAENTKARGKRSTGTTMGMDAAFGPTQGLSWKLGAVMLALLSAGLLARPAAAQAADGWDLSVDNGAAFHVAPGGAFALNSGSNIALTQNNGEVTVALNPNLAVDSMTATGAIKGATGEFTGQLSAGSAVVQGNLQADSATVANQLTAGSAIINGAVQAHQLNASGVTTGTLTATGTSSLRAVNVNNNKISGLADGVVSATSTEAISGKVLYNALNSGNGMKYFHANSTKADSTAGGTDAIAIGPQASAAGEAALAAGLQANAGAKRSVSLGAEAMVDAAAESAVAVGDGTVIGEKAKAGISIGKMANVQGESGIALGQNAAIESEFAKNAVAVGTGAKVTGDLSSDALALGTGATAGHSATIAVGKDAQASSAGAVGIGAGARASAGNALAMGMNAAADTIDSISLGNGAGQGTLSSPGDDRTSHISIGTRAGRNVKGNQDIAVGFESGNDVEGDNNVAVGNHAGTSLKGDYNTALGHQANENAGQIEHATALGAKTRAGTNSVAVGYGASAIQDASVAIGVNAKALEGGGIALGSEAQAEGDSIALGQMSKAERPAATATGYLTGSAAPNSVLSLGYSNAAGELTRRITHVADGSAATDAVNVRQLQAAQNDVGSILGGGVHVGENGKLVGPEAGKGPIKIGDNYYNSINEALSQITTPGGTLGPIDPDVVRFEPNTNRGKITLEQGTGTVISNVAAPVDAMDAANKRYVDTEIANKKTHYVAINSSDASNRENTGASGLEAMAIGPQARATGDQSIAMGYQASTNKTGGVAIGHLTQSLGEKGVVVGIDSEVYGEGGIAIGRDGISKGIDSIVIGTNAQADPKNTSATVNYAVVLGSSAEVTADDGIAIGHEASTSGVRGTAQGFKAHAKAADSVALGSNTSASAAGSVATGSGAQAYGVNSMAMGVGAVAGKAQPNPEDALVNEDMLALGSRASSQAKGSVALGSDSKTQSSYGQSKARYSGVEHDDSKHGVISVGDHGGENGANSIQRRITNVAGGMADTDAVNVRQLRAVRDTPWTFTGNSGSTQQTMDSSVAIVGGNTTSTTSNQNVKTVVTSGTKRTNANGDVVYEGGKIEIQFAETPHFKGADMGGQKITNVADGTVSSTSKDAVNGSQLYQVENKPITFQGNTGSTPRKLGETQVIKGTLASSAAANTSNIRTSVNSAGEMEILLANNLTADSLTINNGGPVINGGGINMGGKQITNLADGTQNNHAVNLGQLNTSITNLDTTLTAKGMNFGADGGTDVHRDLGQKLLVKGDSNITTTADGADTLTVALNKNLTADSLTINNGGPVINGGGINMGGKQITNLADGTQNDHAVNLGQLKDVEATANAGWNLGTNGDPAAKVAPGGKVDLSSSDGNIVLTQTGTDVNLTLSKDLALTNVTVQGNTTVNNLTATGVTKLGDHFTVNQGGDVHYDGPITENTHIVNKEYVDNSSQAVIDNNPLTFKGSDGSTTERKLGETLEVVGSNGNITTEAKDGKLTIALNDDLKVENVTVNQNLTVNGDTILNNLTTTGVTRLGDHFTVNQGGDVHYDGPITENTHIVNKEYVDNSSQNVINNNPLTFKGSDGSTTDRKLGETLVVEGSNSNIATHAQDGKLTIALNDDLDLNSVKTGNTTMNKDGVVVLDEDGKPSIVMNNKGFSVGDNVALTSNGLKAFDVVINQQGINAGGHKITNVAAGTADTDAVNVSQLKQVEQNLTDRAVKYDLNSDGTVNKGKVSMEGDKSTDGGRTGGTGITNVARGDISSNSTDAVNGSQISDMGDSIAQGMGGGSRFEDGKLVTELNVGGNTYHNVNDALGGLDNKIDNIGQVASAGWNIRTNGDVADKVAPGSTVQFLNGDNIEITRSGLDVKVALAQDIKVNSVVAKSVTTNELKIENGPTINQNGIDMHDKTISNVADGKAPQDAVNVRQLGQATANIQGQINHLDGRINKVENRANAGIAAALATAGLPQAYMPGKSMFSVAGGAWNGESGYAMGLSTVSDNGSWVLKGTVAGSSRGDYGGSVGVGYQW